MPNLFALKLLTSYFRKFRYKINSPVFFNTSITYFFSAYLIRQKFNLVCFTTYFLPCHLIKHVRDLLLSFLPLLIFSVFSKDIHLCGYFLQYYSMWSLSSVSFFNIISSILFFKIISYFSLLLTNSLNPQKAGKMRDQWPNYQFTSTT